MLPRDLKAEQFASYPPEARKLVTQNLPALQRLPLVFLPSLLREVIEYDFKFPAERKAIDREVANFAHLSPDQISDWFGAFSRIELSSKLERFDWVNSPAQFVEQLSAHLWRTHQLDAFRLAATAYAGRLHAAAPPEPPPIPRLGISIIGQGVEAYSAPVFRYLRPHGVYFKHVNPQDGLSILLDAVASRAKARPISYGHFYIDGGEAPRRDESLAVISYSGLAQTREILLRKMRADIDTPGMGPEMLRTHMAELTPAELGMITGDPILNRFQIKLLTEGSGTQIYSTSFAQWAARECLRRAQPVTLLVRFAPRQRQKAMYELIAAGSKSAELDPVGSLVDGDMGAYYNWLNQQRLPGAEKSSFVAWFEGHNSAVAIGPAMPRGTESDDAVDLKKLLDLIA